MILTVPWRRGDYLGSGRVQELDAAVSPVHGTKEGGGRGAKSGKRGGGGTPREGVQSLGQSFPPG